jgi:hypothetical protein
MMDRLPRVAFDNDADFFTESIGLFEGGLCKGHDKLFSAVAGDQVASTGVVVK